MAFVKTFFRTIGHILRNLIIFLIVLAFLAGLAASYFIYRGTQNYPVAYGDLIEKVASEEGVAPALVAAVVRTESDFDADVVAFDGGVGLMQLMPDTLDWSAKRMGVDPSTLDPKDPETNLSVGTHYLAYLIDRYQSEDLAIVAYNTGFANVDGWLKDGTITWDIETMNRIPYEVPRNYVQRVNKAQEIYQTFYGHDLPDNTWKENTLKLAFQNLLSTLGRFWSEIGIF